MNRNTTENDPIQIVACLDKDFVLTTGVMMCSACVNHPDTDIDFHLICDESVTENDKKDLEETVLKYPGKRTIFYNIDSQLSNKFPCRKGFITRATYYRLFLTEILPPSVSKVIYIDGDCIIRHSLLPLWNTDITDYAVGACTDGLEGVTDFYERLGYPREESYFNAGVMYINLDYWRRHHVLEQSMDILNNHRDKIFLEDQDVMNMLFHDRKITLPLKYNLQAGLLWKDRHWNYQKLEEQFKDALEDPVIIHYTTIGKPWYRTSSYHPHPFRDSFYKYQSMTKWNNVRIENRPKIRRIRNFVGDILRRMNMRQLGPSQYIDVHPVD